MCVCVNVESEFISHSDNERMSERHDESERCKENVYVAVFVHLDTMIGGVCVHMHKCVVGCRMQWFQCTSKICTLGCSAGTL